MKARRAVFNKYLMYPAGPILGLILTACGDEPSGFVERYQPDYESRSSDSLSRQAETLDQENGGIETRGGDGGDSSGDDGFDPTRPGYGSANGPTTPEELREAARSLPKFGLLVNDLECGLCHVQVVGNVASTRRVPPLWTDSTVHLTGAWWAAEAFDADARPSVNVNAAGGIHRSYQGPELPLDRTGDGRPDFPVINFNNLKNRMRGSVEAKQPQNTQVSKVHNGNLILIGTSQAPIKINEDILVTGDLVIKGIYTGVGTIYVQGNIYIPADLTAKRSAFPYSDQESQAIARAEAQMAANNTDALGLATPKSIFIADLEKHQNTYADLAGQTVYNFHATPLNRRADALGVYQIYDWFPGGRTEYNKLYEQALNCNNQPTQTASFNMVEAFLYAQNTVAGISRQASYSIRGGVIADYFHVVSGSSLCSPQSISAAHGKSANRSYIEYDYRIKTGQLGILEYIGAQFPKMED